MAIRDYLDVIRDYLDVIRNYFELGVLLDVGGDDVAVLIEHNDDVLAFGLDGFDQEFVTGSGDVEFNHSGRFQEFALKILLCKLEKSV